MSKPLMIFRKCVNTRHMILCHIFILFFSTSVYAENACTDEEIASQRSLWGIDASELNDISSAVIKAFKDRSLSDINNLIVVDQLSVGPLRSRFESSNFSDVFPEEVRKEVLASGPTCSFLNSQGALLGGGVWLSQVGSRLGIIAMTEYREIRSYNPKDIVVAYEGATVPPNCFTYLWSSGDNFEAMAKHWKVSYDELISSPGQFLNTDTARGFVPEWCGGGTIQCDQRHLVELKTDLERCMGLYPEPTVRGNEVISSLGDNDWEVRKVDSYTLLAELPPQTCEDLSTSSDVLVTECYAVQIDSYRWRSVNIYAILEGGFLAPMKFFNNENDYKAYIESM